MTDSTASVALRLTDVSVNMGGNSILERVSASIQRGRITAIIGPNGAGKTTLLQAILGLIPFSGVIEFFDQNGAANTTPRLGYVPQHLNLDRQAAISVLEFMALETQWKPVWLGISPPIREKCAEALSRLEAAHLLDRPLGKLSGGELQRVLLALNLHRNPDLILLDEPVSGVDVAGGHLFCDVLDELSRERRVTILMVSHDLSVVSQHASHVLCLNRTLSCIGETPQVLTSKQLLDLFGPHSGLHHHTSQVSESECQDRESSQKAGEPAPSRRAK